MRWFGEEKTKPNQERRDDGLARGTDCQVDWTGLDRTGPGPNQGEGDEKQQSGGGNRNRHKIRQIR